MKGEARSGEGNISKVHRYRSGRLPEYAPQSAKVVQKPLVEAVAPPAHILARKAKEEKEKLRKQQEKEQHAKVQVKTEIIEVKQEQQAVDCVPEEVVEEEEEEEESE